MGSVDGQKDGKISMAGGTGYTRKKMLLRQLALFICGFDWAYTMPITTRPRWKHGNWNIFHSFDAPDSLSSQSLLFRTHLIALSPEVLRSSPMARQRRPVICSSNHNPPSCVAGQ